MKNRPILLTASTLFAIASPGCVAQAQADLFSGSKFTVLTDVRLVAGDAERSWLQGGYGKTRFGSGDTALEPRIAEALLAWTPRINDNVSGVLSIEVQDGQDDLVDLGEAYIVWRGHAGGGPRFSGRAGLYFPLISLEHDGPDWSVNDTLTPSAINSWVAEEVKVGGVEATLAFDALGGDIAVTAGVFGYGDKAGTLLAFRGWALHDLKATHTAVFPLPPIGDLGRTRAEPRSTATIEIDDEIGAYVRVEWRPSPNSMVSVVGYDNAGDRVSRVGNEGAWDTRFVAASAAWPVDDLISVRAQVLTGDTAVGGATPGAFRAEVEYTSAYVSVTRAVGPGGLTARVDQFETRDLVSRSSDNNDEDGWAATLAYRWDYKPGADITVEALTIESTRPSRARIGEDADQQDLQIQMAFRNRF